MLTHRLRGCIVPKQQIVFSVGLNFDVQGAGLGDVKLHGVFLAARPTCLLDLGSHEGPVAPGARVSTDHPGRAFLHIRSSMLPLGLPRSSQGRAVGSARPGIVEVSRTRV